MSIKKTYSKNEVTTWPFSTYWDVLALFIIIGVLFLFGWGCFQMVGTYHLGEQLPINLSLFALPGYGLRTIIRLFIALGFSLLATLILGTLAAKNRYCERIIIPLVDILQSVPILSFLAFAVAGFIMIFKNNLIGLECAAIFGVFTAQVWNMILNFYQELKSVPWELEEAAAMLRLTPWRKFWQVEVPYAAPGLVWNMMMSLSGSWFFVIACEAFSFAGNDITLPGIGSYIFMANQTGNITALFNAIFFMLLLIFLYDQMIFRPILYWIDNFKEDYQSEDSKKPWVWSLFQRSQFGDVLQIFLKKIWHKFLNLPFFNKVDTNEVNKKNVGFFKFLYYLIVFLIAGITIFSLIFLIVQKINYREIIHVFYLGGITGLRVFVLILISALFWIPIGVWIGLRPKWVAILQPIIQFLAAFPANLFFSFFAFLIITFQLNVEIFVSPLIILGTQWYILFNVIAGASKIPLEIRLAADNFKIRGWLWWKKLILPGIAPYLVTGAITAAGGAWNASIVAEVIKWKDQVILATGLGAYICEQVDLGNSLKIALGTVIMCIIVFIINRLFWKPLYDYVSERFRY